MFENHQKCLISGQNGWFVRFVREQYKRYRRLHLWIRPGRILGHLQLVGIGAQPIRFLRDFYRGHFGKQSDFSGCFTSYACQKQPRQRLSCQFSLGWSPFNPCLSSTQSKIFLKFAFKKSKFTLFLGGQTVFIFVDHGCCQLQNTVLHAGMYSCNEILFMPCLYIPRHAIWASFSKKKYWDKISFT